MIEIQTSLLFTKKELKILKNSKRKKIKSKIQKNKKFIPIFILASYFLFLILLNILIYVFNYNDCLEFAYCILVSLFSIALLTLYFFGKTNSSNITNKEKQKIIREYYEL